MDEVRNPIDILETCLADRAHGATMVYSIMTRIEKAVELLKEQQAKWIPIKEQMPELKRCVLVYCPQFRNIYTAWTDGERWYYFGHGAFSEMFEEPSHWMKTPSEP